MTEAATVTIDQNRFAALIDMRERAVEALAQWNTAKLTAKDKHNAYENARETFEREWDRFVKSTRGEDLPLFSSMADAVDAAKSDPVVTKLVERLIARGHDVNALIVHGYTEEERNAVTFYLDGLDTVDRMKEVGDEPLPEIEVPAFLVPQPLTAVEMADLIGRLKAAEFEIPPSTIESWSQGNLAEIKAWLDETERVKEAKGDALTVDDLPVAPDLLYRPVEDESSDEDESGDETEARAEA